MGKLLRILKEINNYIFLIRKSRSHSKSETWQNQKYPLRINWIGTIYTVINLPPEVYNTEYVWERNYIIEECKPINRYLASINLGEILELKVKKINRPNTEAYLIRYKPLFEEFTWWWIIKTGVIIWFLTYLQLKFDYIGKIVKLGSVILSWFENIISPYLV